MMAEIWNSQQLMKMNTEMIGVNIKNRNNSLQSDCYNFWILVEQIIIHRSENVAQKFVPAIKSEWIPALNNNY